MKQRSPVTSLLLALFVPFYYLYWLYVTGKTINSMGGKAPSIMLILAPFLLFISAVVLSIGVTAAGGDGTGMNAIILLFGLLSIPAFIVLPIIFDYKFSKAFDSVTNGYVSTGTGFVLMFFVAPAAVYMFQDKLNELAGAPQQTTATPAEQPAQPTGSPAFASNQQPPQQTTVAPQQQPPAPAQQPATQPQPNTEQQQQPPQTNQLQ